MRELWIDPRLGAAGDMFVAGLIAAGADEALVLHAARSAADELGGADVQLERCEHEGLPAARLRVRLKQQREHLHGDEAQQALERALGKLGLGHEHAEFARRALGILLEAEQAAHSAEHLGHRPELVFIGTAHTPYTPDNPPPPQPAFSEQPAEPGDFWVDIYEQYAPGLEGLEQFKCIYVISYLHRSHGYTLTVCPPWIKDGRRPVVGLFACRSPNRPNPIGLTITRLVKIDGNRIYTGPLDLYDGTPVIDIKPCVRRVDGVEHANNGWLEGADLIGHEHRHDHPHSHSGPVLHEAQDILVDVVGAAAALAALETDVARVRCLHPVNVGGGTITGSHGTLRVPPPAVREILWRHRIPHCTGPIDVELLTPTGAAVLAALRPQWVAREAELPGGAAVGVGLGTRPLPTGGYSALYIAAR